MKRLIIGILLCILGAAMLATNTSATSAPPPTSEVVDALASIPAGENIRGFNVSVTLLGEGEE